MVLKRLGKYLGLFSSSGPRTAPISRRTPGYRAFATDFDKVVAAKDISAAIGPLAREHETAVEDAWNALELGLAGWKVENLILAADTASGIRQAMPSPAFSDVVVSILVDHSGSMRGQKILYAAAAVDIVQEFLRTLGTKVEVLGFTTSSWQGGKSRKLWIADGRPPDPGRLNDLLHIIYREGDDTRSASMAYGLKAMLRPDLPKENIDGEAIEWAVGRLRARPETRKILLVVSDGAPVDDATLMANGPTYLHDHVLQVIREVETAADVELLGVGLGHAVGSYYRMSAYCEIPESLAEATLALLGQHLSAPRPGGEDA